MMSTYLPDAAQNLDGARLQHAHDIARRAGARPLTEFEGADGYLERMFSPLFRSSKAERLPRSLTERQFRLSGTMGWWLARLPLDR